MLMLIYLTSWTERSSDVPRFWKNHDFDTLSALADRDLIVDGRRAKSAYLTVDGIEHARRLLAKYGIESEA